MLRTKFLNHLNVAKVLGVLVILLAYAPGVLKESFWSDDYPALTDTSNVVNHVLKDARPISAALLSVSFSSLKSPSNAWILRSLALVALLLIFLFIAKRIKNSKHYNFGVFSIAIGFCLPSFQMFIHWSITWFFLWAALAGMYAFHFWSSNRILKKVLAVLLLGLAITTYPPTALFFFSVIATINVLNESKSSSIFLETIRGLKLLVISGLASVASVFIFMRIAGLSPNGRVKLVGLSEIPRKIAWIVSRPIVVGLRPFTIDSPTAKIALITSLPVLLILFLGVRQQSRQLEENILYRAIWIAIPLVLTLAPIMITSDNQIEFRVLPGYCWGIATIASYFLLRMIGTGFDWLKWRAKAKNFTLILVTATLGLVAIISVNSHYSDLFGGPYQKKTEFLNAKISACFGGRSIKNVLILPPKTPFPSFKRLGVFSMSTDLASDWVPKPNVELLLKQRNIVLPVVYLATRPMTIKAITTECVIDLEDFRKLLI